MKRKYSIFYNLIHAYLKMYCTFSFLKKVKLFLYSSIPPGIIKQCKKFQYFFYTTWNFLFYTEKVYLILFLLKQRSISLPELYLYDGPCGFVFSFPFGPMTTLDWMISKVLFNARITDVCNTVSGIHSFTIKDYRCFNIQSCTWRKHKWRRGLEW